MSKADFLKHANSVQNYEPKTGIGRFDATYSPTQKRLTIKVKLNFTFLSMKQFERDTGVTTWATRPDGPAWTPFERAFYRNAFKTIVEDSWSRQYKFACTKPGWSEFTAAVHFNIDPNVQRTDAHYWIQVGKAPTDEPIRAMVSHAPDWNGRFGQIDIEPEQAKKR